MFYLQALVLMNPKCLGQYKQRALEICSHFDRMRMLSCGQDVHIILVTCTVFSYRGFPQRYITAGFLRGKRFISADPHLRVLLFERLRHVQTGFRDGSS